MIYLQPKILFLPAISDWFSLLKYFPNLETLYIQYQKPEQERSSIEMALEGGFLSNLKHLYLIREDYYYPSRNFHNLILQKTKLQKLGLLSKFLGSSTFIELENELPNIELYSSVLLESPYPDRRLQQVIPKCDRAILVQCLLNKPYFFQEHNWIWYVIRGCGKLLRALKFEFDIQPRLLSKGNKSLR